MTRPLSSRQHKKQKKHRNNQKQSVQIVQAAKFFCETRYPFAVRSEATNGEGIGHLSVTQYSVRFLIMLLYPFNDLLIDLLTMAWCSFKPFVICRTRNMNSITQLCDRILLRFTQIFAARLSLLPLRVSHKTAMFHDVSHTFSIYLGSFPCHSYILPQLLFAAFP